MLTFLFWNLDNSPRDTIVANLVRKHQVDVLILAELHSRPAVLQALNHDRADYFLVPSRSRLAIYSRFADRYLGLVDEETNQNKTFTVRHLSLPKRVGLLFVAVHFLSKLSFSLASQDAECMLLARDICQFEAQVGHTRTLVIGDLNANPFQNGVISATGFHAVMTKQLARKKKRVVQGREYRFFYNPMWKHFGDGTPGPAGTYYYWKAEHNVLFWNIHDQVLLRPDLLNFYEHDNLEILTSDGTIDFLTKDGLPDREIASDHLPILLRLNL